MSDSLKMAAYLLGTALVAAPAGALIGDGKTDLVAILDLGGQCAQAMLMLGVGLEAWTAWQERRCPESDTFYEYKSLAAWIAVVTCILLTIARMTRSALWVQILAYIATLLIASVAAIHSEARYKRWCDEFYAKRSARYNTAQREDQ